MRQIFSQKTPLWPGLKDKKSPQRGGLTIFSAFLFFLFSSLGLSLIYLSQVYLKLSGYKKNVILLDYASENGIKAALQHLQDKLDHGPSPFILSQEEIPSLWSDVSNGGTRLPERYLGGELPLLVSGSWDKLKWDSTTGFSVVEAEERDGWFQATFKTDLFSRGSLAHFQPSGKIHFEGSLDFFAGRLPLPLIPLLIQKDLTEAEKTSYLSANDIVFSASPGDLMPAQTIISDAPILPTDVIDLAAKALNIKLFSLQSLSHRQLRQALGLEITDDPIPEGVYLVEDDLGLCGVYVQGDLDHLLLAVDGDHQVLDFSQQDDRWRLAYSPSRSETRFISPESASEYDLLPRGIVIVEGSILSLAGGIVDESGEVLLNPTQDVPCVLGGVSLTILSSNEVAISSHLLHQGVEWTKGLPYIKDSSSQLNILALGENISDGVPRAGRIIIDENAPEEPAIQASLSALKGEFRIEGTGKTVRLLGSLHAADYYSAGSSLRISPDSHLIEKLSLLEDAPRTSVPIVLVSSFKPLAWRVEH